MQKEVLIAIAVGIVLLFGGTVLMDAFTANQDVLEAEKELTGSSLVGNAVRGAVRRFTGSINYLSCKDTDYGLNYEEKGEATVRYKIGPHEYTKTFQDYCGQGNVIREYYCDENRLAVSTRSCEEICAEGICAGIA